MKAVTAFPTAGGTGPTFLDGLPVPGALCPPLTGAHNSYDVSACSPIFRLSR